MTKQKLRYILRNVSLSLYGIDKLYHHIAKTGVILVRKFIDRWQCSTSTYQFSTIFFMVMNLPLVLNRAGEVIW